VEPEAKIRLIAVLMKLLKRGKCFDQFWFSSQYIDHPSFLCTGSDMLIAVGEQFISKSQLLLRSKELAAKQATTHSPTPSAIELLHDVLSRVPAAEVTEGLRNQYTVRMRTGRNRYVRTKDQSLNIR
jgi:CMP-N-acetylneuraminic acid synthetase